MWWREGSAAARVRAPRRQQSVRGSATAHGARLRWREGSATGERAGRRRQRVACCVAFIFTFYIEKVAAPPGEEPTLMAHPITVDPNPTPGRTGGDVIFLSAVKGVRGVVY